MNLDALPDLEFDNSWLREFLDGGFLSPATSGNDLHRASPLTQVDNIAGSLADQIRRHEDVERSDVWERNRSGRPRLELISPGTSARTELANANSYQGNFGYDYSQVHVSPPPGCADNEFREAALRNRRPRESYQSGGGLTSDETPERRGTAVPVVGLDRPLSLLSEPIWMAPIEHISPSHPVDPQRAAEDPLQSRRTLAADLSIRGQQFGYGSSPSTDPYRNPIEDSAASGSRPLLLREAFQPIWPSYPTLGVEVLENDNSASIDPYLTAASNAAATLSHLLPQASMSGDMNRNYSTNPLLGPALPGHGPSRFINYWPARARGYTCGPAQVPSSESYLDQTISTSGYTNRPSISPDLGIGIDRRRYQARHCLALPQAMPGLGKGKPLTPLELRTLGCPPQGQPGRLAFVEASVSKLDLSWSHQPADLQATMHVPAPSIFHLPASADGTIKLSGARTKNEAWTGYQQGDVPIPAHLTLVEVCQNFPNHVWGAGLRPFIAAHWHTNDVWSYIPENAKLKTAMRNNNYYQKAFCREGDKIRKEFDLPPRGKYDKSYPKRKVLKEAGEDFVEHSDEGSELTELSSATPKRRKTDPAKGKGQTRSGKIGSNFSSFDVPFSSGLTVGHHVPPASREAPMLFQRSPRVWSGHDGSQVHANRGSIMPGLQHLRQCLRPPLELLQRNDRLAVRHGPSGQDHIHREHIASLYDLGDDCLNEVERQMDLLSQIHWTELAIQQLPSARRSILEYYWMRRFPSFQADRKEEVDGARHGFNPMPYLRNQYQQMYHDQPTRSAEKDDRSQLVAWNWCLQQFLDNLRRRTRLLEHDWRLQSTQTWQQPQEPFQLSNPNLLDTSGGLDLQGLTTAHNAGTGSGPIVQQPPYAYGLAPGPTGSGGFGRPMQSRGPSKQAQSNWIPNQMAETGGAGSVESVTPEEGGYRPAIQTPP